jgi:steroid delta-isomerase-like uncharacterized protein
MQDAVEQLITSYYTAFNQQDMRGFLDLLNEDIVHDINQGHREHGKEAFSAFMQRMNQHYKEQIIEISITSNKAGNRAAAEFTVVGQYLSTDQGLPVASGQSYLLPAGAFFEINKGKISRVSNYYNLQDWITQVNQ